MNDKKWQLVPREPTQAMWEAASLAYKGVENWRWEDIWYAMLAAAPQPPEPGRLSGEREARAAFDRLGLTHWDAFWLGWCERAAAGSDGSAYNTPSPTPTCDREAIARLEAEVRAVADELEKEGDIAARPGQCDRLHALAARLRAAGGGA